MRYPIYMFIFRFKFYINSQYVFFKLYLSSGFLKGLPLGGDLKMFIGNSAAGRRPEKARRIEMLGE